MPWEHMGYVHSRLSSEVWISALVYDQAFKKGQKCHSIEK